MFNFVANEDFFWAHCLPFIKILVKSQCTRKKKIKITIQIENEKYEILCANSTKYKFITSYITVKTLIVIFQNCHF